MVQLLAGDRPAGGRISSRAAESAGRRVRDRDRHDPGTTFRAGRRISMRAMREAAESAGGDAATGAGVPLLAGESSGGPPAADSAGGVRGPGGGPPNQQGGCARPGAGLSRSACRPPRIASAAPVPASPTPLPGSEFQGGDGDQNDATPYVDWQHLQAIGAAVHAPDHEGPDSAFEGGTKENEPGSWTLTSEADAGIAGKADILDAWGSVDQRGGNTFLYLAFTRRAAEGNTYVAFELNRDTRLWNNGRATIPCRTTGDLLVAFTAHGNSMDVVLERWTTTASDAATRCAKTGRLDAVASIPAGTAQGDVNESSITNHLPGVLPSPIAPGRFGEVGAEPRPDGAGGLRR
jgi:hypothetical protein